MKFFQKHFTLAATPLRAPLQVTRIVCRAISIRGRLIQASIQELKARQALVAGR